MNNNTINLDNGYLLNIRYTNYTVPVFYIEIYEISVKLYELKLSVNDMISIINRLNCKFDTEFISSLSDKIAVKSRGISADIVINDCITIELSNKHIGMLVDVFTQFLKV